MWRQKLAHLTLHNEKLFIFKKILIRCLLISTIIIITALIIVNIDTIHTDEPPTTEAEPETEEQKEQRVIAHLDINLDNDLWIPDGGDNITGWPMDIVPNVVHYVLFETHKISYVQMLSIFSVIQIHKPEEIIIHCDCDRIDDGDEHWDRIINLVNETNEVILRINQIERPTKIFGTDIKPENVNFHGSDITRYGTLKKYGGIYLDNDIFVTQPLHEFRKFEFTLNWDEDQYLGAQVLIGNRNARFLKFVIKTYQEAYDPEKWYYNAGDLPTKAILWKYPHLVHRVKVKFGVDAPAVCPYFYSEHNDDWQTKFYTFHMCARGNTISWKGWCLGDEKHFMWNATFNDDYIKTLNNTFGDMARFVLFGNKDI